MGNLKDLPSQINVTSRIASLKKENHLQISFVPLRKNSLTGRVEMLTGFDLTLIPSPRTTKSGIAISREYTSRSILASGKWVKIRVVADGIHSLSYEQLRQIGIDDPSSVRVFGNGGGMLPRMNLDPRHDDLVENAIINTGNKIIFYGQSPHVWKYDESTDFFNKILHNYSDGTYYFLTSGPGSGLKVQDSQSPSSPANHTSTSFDALRHHEIEDINLIKSGREWYGEHFDILTEQSFDMSLGGTLSGKEVKLRIETVGRASTQTIMQVSANGNLL